MAQPHEQVVVGTSGRRPLGPRAGVERDPVSRRPVNRTESAARTSGRSVMGAPGKRPRRRPSPEATTWRGHSRHVVEFADRPSPGTAAKRAPVKPDSAVAACWGSGIRFALLISVFEVTKR